MMIKNQHKKSLLKSNIALTQELPSNWRYYKNFNKELRSYARDIKSDLSHKNKYKKIAYKWLSSELYKYLQKKEHDKINKELKSLRLAKLANNNISESGMVNIRQLAAMPVKTLRKIGKLRNIDSKMSKSDTIYALIRSEPVINENKLIIDGNNEIRSKINNIRLQLFNVSPYLIKKKRGNIRKRLYDIGKMTKIDRKMKIVYLAT